MAKIAACICILLALQSALQAVRKLQAQADDSNVDDKYAIVEQVGQGSFGVVYKATTKLNEPVAIKSMKGKVSEDALKEQCKNVQKLHATIEEHPGKNHVMNCLESQPKYVVYEWAGKEGTKLLPTLSFEEALALLKQVIIALHALLQSPRTTIVHHDLKWENVAVNDEFCLKLIDLDDWQFANWGNRLEITVSTPIFSPPEYLRRGPTRRNYFCGLTASQSGNDASAVCPGAYSFDMFSAGIMALQVCAFEWMYFAMHFNEQVTGKGLREMREIKRQQLLMLEYAEEDTVYYSIPFKGIYLLKNKLLQGKSLSTYVSEFDPDQILKVAEHFKERAICHSLASPAVCEGEEFQEKFDKNDPILMQHAEKAKEKFESCKALMSSDKLNIIQSMVSEKPKDRPDPARLLNSELFTGVPTGCSWDVEDGESSYKESTPSEISDEELEEYDHTAIIQDDQDELEIEELIAAVSQDPANASKKEEPLTEVNPVDSRIIEKLQKIGEPHRQDPLEFKVVEQNHSISTPQAQDFGSRLKCNGFDNPEPILREIKIPGGKKVQIQRTDKMGRPLAYCYSDRMFSPAPPDCKLLSFVSRPGKREAQYKYQCICQDLSKND